MHSSLKRRLVLDVAIIITSIAVALWLARIGVFNQTLVAAGQWGVMGCFIAGLFFTSVFTVGPASVGLVMLSQTLPPFQVALWGAVGSVCGDLILFIFMRDKVSRELSDIVKNSEYHQVTSFFRLGFVRVLAPVLGALIIASPLPDELGLALMGLSRTRMALVVPISFVMNFLGILALVAAVHVW
jgi:hypothetical protein